MEPIKIYLSGPIFDMSLKEISVWRDEVERKITYKYGKNNSPFILLNPLRRNFRDSEFQSQNEIVQLDKTDIINANILLVNAQKPSWGTAMEIMFAFQHHKIIVAFTNENYEQTSPWLAFHATRIVKTLDEACEYICKQFP